MLSCNPFGTYRGVPKIFGLRPEAGVWIRGEAVGGCGVAQEGLYLYKGMRNFCLEKSRGAADNFRQSHLSSRFVGVKQSYQLF